MGRLDMLQKFVQWIDDHENNISDISLMADQHMKELIERKGKEYVSHITYHLINENIDPDVDRNDMQTIHEWIEAHR